ncbi:MAG: Hsp20/alpha crystallin family protein [Magnetococcus sp. MYC-9]
MMIAKFDPVRSPRMFQNEINRLFEREMDDASCMASQWPLRVDIREDEEMIFLQADVPGVERDDIKVHVENSRLTIAGERRFEDEKLDTFLRVERAYGSFSRSFQLGAAADVEKIQASCKNGVLLIALPKREDARPRSVEVRVQ